MNRSCARIGIRLGCFFCWLAVIASGEADAQLSGLFQTAPGNLATYTHHDGTYQTEMLPVNLTVSFSNDTPTSMLAATIVEPIIGATADGTVLYPIGSMFPLRVTGSSSNGQDFHGNLLGSQYLFDWNIQPAGGGELLLSGRVYWAGGRIEDTTIENARLVPSLAGDYNQDGSVDAADYVIWRKHDGTTTALPNDPLGGKIGPDHYNQWRTHFGQSTANAAASTTIPEPPTAVLLLLAAAAHFLRFPRPAQIPSPTGRGLG
jgi:hypothetical protein